MKKPNRYPYPQTAHRSREFLQKEFRRCQQIRTARYYDPCYKRREELVAYYGGDAK